MDRRQNKTRKAVFLALVKLLGQKSFERITVQEIIDEADIGRSTFYSHFETREELLRSLVDYLFDRDWAEAGERLPLEQVLVHLLERGRAYRQILQGMYAGGAEATCENCIRELLEELFRPYLPDMALEVPETFALHHFKCSFASAIRWWVREDCPGEPEEVARYYLKLTGI